VSVTAVLSIKFALQVAPQLTPEGADVTRFVGEPVFVTVSV
jgi:hypothetical protein